MRRRGLLVALAGVAVAGAAACMICCVAVAGVYAA
jgi:hypothetical protein